MRQVTNAEIQAYYNNKVLNKCGDGLLQIHKKLQKEAALEAIRQASSIAHLKLVLAWIVEQL